MKYIFLFGSFILFAVFVLYCSIIINEDEREISDKEQEEWLKNYKKD